MALIIPECEFTQTVDLTVDHGKAEPNEDHSFVTATPSCSYCGESSCMTFVVVIGRIWSGKAMLAFFIAHGYIVIIFSACTVYSSIYSNSYVADMHDSWSRSDLQLRTRHPHTNFHARVVSHSQQSCAYALQRFMGTHHVDKAKGGEHTCVVRGVYIHTNETSNVRRLHT